MPSKLYHAYIKQLDEMEEEIFQEDWNILNLNSLGDRKETE